MVRALMVFVVLVGCAHETAQQRQYADALGAWRGQDINRAVEMMGAPSEVFKAPNGRTHYMWVVSGARSRNQQKVFGRVLITKQCKTTFITTPDDIVDVAKSEGQCGVVSSSSLAQTGRPE